MYALRDAAGEARLNEGLKRFLRASPWEGRPTSTTAQLLEEIRPTVPEGPEHLAEDLFERITMFDNRIAAATSTERADGTFLVRIELEAHKRRGDGAGVEREVSDRRLMDIAVFGQEEDKKEDSGARPLPHLLPRAATYPRLASRLRDRSRPTRPRGWRSTRTTSSSTATAATMSAPVLP